MGACGGGNAPLTRIAWGFQRPSFHTTESRPSPTSNIERTPTVDVVRRIKRHNSASSVLRKHMKLVSTGSLLRIARSAMETRDMFFHNLSSHKTVIREFQTASGPLDERAQSPGFPTPQLCFDRWHLFGVRRDHDLRRSN